MKKTVIEPDGLFLTVKPMNSLSFIEKQGDENASAHGHPWNYNSGIYSNNSNDVGKILERNNFQQEQKEPHWETSRELKDLEASKRLTMNDYTVDSEGEKADVQESVITKPIFRKEKRAPDPQEILKTAADILNQYYLGADKGDSSRFTTPKNEGQNKFNELMSTADKILEISKSYVPESAYPTPKKGNPSSQRESHRKQDEAWAELKPVRFKLSDFEIGKKLGKGRFGSVFLAREKKSKYLVALKILSEKELRSAGAEKTFLNEIKIQSYLDHPNILKLYGFFMDENQIVLILEYSVSGELFSLMTKQPEFRFEERVAAGFVKQVSTAIAYMHKNGAIHRDIKPENILINFGVLKLCDFGWANVLNETKRLTFCGTLDYVPPEIVKGRRYDEKADMWSLGVLCYELCSGRAPFESEDQKETFKKILTKDIVTPEFFSPELKDLISKLVVRDPADRLSIDQVLKHPWINMAEGHTEIPENRELQLKGRLEGVLK